MKKYLSILASACCLIFLIGCGLDDKVDPLDLADLKEQLVDPVIRTPMEWRVENGRLVFLDEDHLFQGISILDTMTADSRIAFEDGMGFRSLQSLSKLISDAESASLASFFQNVPDTMEPAYYNSLGYQPSAIYQQHLTLGTIREEVDSIGGISWSLAIDEPLLANVLNANGEVMVGDSLWKIEPRGKLFHGKSSMQEQIGKVSGVTTNRNWIKHIHDPNGNPEIYEGGNYWVMDPCRDADKKFSKKRYRYRAKVMYTCNFTNYMMSPTLTLDAEAHRKYGNRWDRDVAYKPLWGMYHTWRYRNYFKKNTNPNIFTVESTTLGFSTVIPYPTSPYYVHDTMSNNFNKSLHPTGNHPIGFGSTWKFADNCEIHSASFVFKFTGCSNGLDLTAY